MAPWLRFLLSSVVGLGFFARPVPVNGQWTVAFDVAGFALRTALLVPLAAGVTHLYGALGVFAGLS